MATIGASLVIISIIPYFWGVIERSFPIQFPQEVYDVGGVRVSSIDLITIAVSAACVLAFAVFFKFTTIGLQMRAAASHNEAAILSGVNSTASRRSRGDQHDPRVHRRRVLANQQGNVTLPSARSACSRSWPS
jgi:branched-subunit amino acid ABC-type transport system permease component